MSEEMLTVAQVAEELNVHVKTVRSWINSGQLSALELGKGFRIKREDLNNFLETRRIHREKSQGDK